MQAEVKAFSSVGGTFPTQKNKLPWLIKQYGTQAVSMISDVLMTLLIKTTFIYFFCINEWMRVLLQVSTEAVNVQNEENHPAEDHGEHKQ